MSRIDAKSLLKPALQVLKDFRSQLCLAEELVAKLSYHLRELQSTEPSLRDPLLNEVAPSHRGRSPLAFPKKDAKMLLATRLKPRRKSELHPKLLLFSSASGQQVSEKNPEILSPLEED